MGDRTAPIVARTLRAAMAAEEAAFGLPPADGAPPHPAAPAVGASVVTAFTVTESDTAHAMGHPDPSVNVLGSPRIGLWFEVATGPLMPAPGGAVRHVGVGLVVHHLAAAAVGEDVAIEARVVETSGRAVVFILEATAGERCIARGVHHRRILDADH
jgi:predicted thioesterase